MIFSDLKNGRSKILSFLEFRLTAKFASKLVWISKILLRKFKTTFDPTQKWTFWYKGSLELMFLHIEKMRGSLGSVWIVFFYFFHLAPRGNFLTSRSNEFPINSSDHQFRSQIIHLTFLTPEIRPIMIRWRLIVVQLDKVYGYNADSGSCLWLQSIAYNIEWAVRL